MQQIRRTIQEKQPLIHCITNPISINQCANAILAVGARPIMAEHPLEVAEITETAAALLLNLGNITDVRMASIQIAAKTAGQKGIPMILDVVGLACSELRRTYVAELLQQVTPQIIKGNYSEIHALYHGQYRASGVDADRALSQTAVEETAVQLARAYGTVVLASGKTDIITDGKTLCRVHNGSPQLATITGTGCLLGALCACYLSADPGLYAAVTGCAVLGICGQLAETPQGPGTFLMHLLDRLAVLSHEELQTYLNLEEVKLENL